MNGAIHLAGFRSVVYRLGRADEQPSRGAHVDCALNIDPRTNDPPIGPALDCIEGPRELNRLVVKLPRSAGDSSAAGRRQGQQGREPTSRDMAIIMGSPRAVIARGPLIDNTIIPIILWCARRGMAAVSF